MLSEAEVAFKLRDAQARKGSHGRWGNHEKAAAAAVEVAQLRAVLARIRADKALAAAGVKYEEYEL